MYKIYFEDKVIIFDNNTEKYNGKNEILLHDASFGEPSWNRIRPLLTHHKCVVIPASDIHAAFTLFRRSVRVIQAGGGVVQNRQKQVLLIHRLGRWDLPKGKLEEGESIDMCSRREVSEECGLSYEQIVVLNPLCNSHHLYCMKSGEWVLKETSWYAMQYQGDEPLIPQTEEGIDDVRWVDKELVPTYLKNSYPTIRDVYQAALDNKCICK